METTLNIVDSAIIANPLSFSINLSDLGFKTNLEKSLARDYFLYAQGRMFLRNTLDFYSTNTTVGVVYLVGHDGDTFYYEGFIDATDSSAEYYKELMEKGFSVNLMSLLHKFGNEKIIRATWGFVLEVGETGSKILEREEIQTKRLVTKAMVPFPTEYNGMEVVYVKKCRTDLKGYLRVKTLESVMQLLLGDEKSTETTIEKLHTATNDIRIENDELSVSFSISGPGELIDDIVKKGYKIEPVLYGTVIDGKFYAERVDKFTVSLNN